MSSDIPDIDHATLKDVCNAPFEDFEKLGAVTRKQTPGTSYTVVDKDGTRTVNNPGTEKRYIFIDHGASVLAVAHLDTVHDSDHYNVQKLGGKAGVGGKYYIFSTALDDRLGAWLIMYYLPKIVGDNRWDILLTEGEEHGSSSAKFFNTSKSYNWMFMFDRATQFDDTVDAVTYQYTGTVKLVEKYGWKHGIGSYSCIRELEHLRCKGFNFGAGYEDNHQLTSHAVIDNVQFSAACFQRFFADNADVSMPHEKYIAPAYVYTPPVPFDTDRGIPGWRKTEHGVWVKDDKPIVCPRCSSVLDHPSDLIDVIDPKQRVSKRCLICYQFTDAEIAEWYYDGRFAY